MDSVEIQIRKRYIKAMRAANNDRRRRPPRPPKWLPPKKLEREYSLTLVRVFVKSIEEAVEKFLIPALPSLIPDVNRDRSDAFPQTIDELFAMIHRYTGDEFSLEDMQSISRDMANKVSIWNNAQWQKILRSVLGVDLFFDDPALRLATQSFVSENVSLIKSIRNQSLDRIESRVYAGIRQGDRWEGVAKTIREEYGVTERRARLIGRDQVNKLNGKLTQNRQEQIGVKRYKWRTAIDERVRGNPGGLYPKAKPSHWHREGNVYNWNEPPKGGHPGIPIQCRCIAEPDLDDLFKETSPIEEEVESNERRQTTKRRKV